MLNPFDWIRRKTAQAVIDGVSDGLEAINPDGATVPPLQIEQLQERVALVLAAPAEKAPKGKAGAK